MVESEVSVIRDLPVILPDGRLLGTVHDTVVETDSWTCTHIFVADPPADLVEVEFMLQFRGIGSVLLEM